MATSVSCDPGASSSGLRRWVGASAVLMALASASCAGDDGPPNVRAFHGDAGEWELVDGLAAGPGGNLRVNFDGAVWDADPVSGQVAMGVECDEVRGLVWLAGHEGVRFEVEQHPSSPSCSESESGVAEVRQLQLESVATWRRDGNDLLLFDAEGDRVARLAQPEEDA